MADDASGNPDNEAKKWFALAVIGTLLYVGTVFVFVINADPGAGATGNKQLEAEVQEHGQSH
jgi:hypothetical protein